MKKKSKYNFLYIIPLYYSNFIAISCYVSLKIVVLFLIPSDQTGGPESHFVRGCKI